MRNDFDEVYSKIAKTYSVDCVYDIGSNNGAWTKDFLSKHNAKDVHLFEANPIHNTSSTRNGHNVLLTSRENIGKELDFFSIGGTGDSYKKEMTRFYENVEPIKLVGVSLDEYVKERNIPFPDVIKIDVQGAELDVFDGGIECLDHCMMVLSEVPIFDYNSEAPIFDEYIRFLSSRDFVPVGIEQIHYPFNILHQIDIVFLKKTIKEKLLR